MQSATRRRWINFVLIIVAPFGIALGLYVHTAQQLDAQRARNTFLGAAVASLDSKVREIRDFDGMREELIELSHLYETTVTEHGVSVETLDWIAHSVVPGVALREIAYEPRGKRLRIEGRALSANHVARFTRSPQGWRPDPQVSMRVNAQGVVEFTLEYPGWERATLERLRY